jgi:hypothetical protein
VPELLAIPLTVDTEPAGMELTQAPAVLEITGT